MTLCDHYFSSFMHVIDVVTCLHVYSFVLLFHIRWVIEKLHVCVIKGVIPLITIDDCRGHNILYQAYCT